MKEKIFVQIASYRDPELLPTIRDCIARAKFPENLTFGIVWQRDETETLEELIEDPRFKIIDIHWSESKGLGWARNLTQTLWDGEQYTLQIDSHHRFVEDWDRILLEDFRQALTIAPKPIITTYCTPFNPADARDTWNTLPSLMSQYEFSSDKLLMSMPWYIQDYKTRSRVIRARTLSGHFYFTTGNFVKEVPYDPDIYFGGYTEETTMSVRAFTHGYDFFSPYRMVMWHEYTRAYRVKHWDDHGVESKTKQTSGERDIFSRKKTRQLFEQEDNGIDMGNYGLGSVRTLRDYEIYAGLDFKNCRIHDYTLKVNEPPNPLPWEDGFITNEFNLNLEWDVEFFKHQNLTKPKFLTLGVQSSSGLELYRKDFTSESGENYLRLMDNKFSVTIRSIDKPNKIVMYLFDEEKGWSSRYEKHI